MKNIKTIMTIFLALVLTFAPALADNECEEPILPDDYIPLLVYDAKNPTTIPPGTTTDIHVSGGVAPYTWETSDPTKYTFNSSTTGTILEVDSSYINTLASEVSACTPVTVTITDSSSSLLMPSGKIYPNQQVSGDLNLNGKPMAWDYENSDQTIARGGSASLVITGCSGVDYSWSVSGTGFSLASSTTTGLTNTLYADITACGSASVTVTCDGGSASGEVRCAAGVWVLKGTGSAALGYISGLGDLQAPVSCPSNYTLYKVVGKYWLYERFVTKYDSYCYPQAGLRELFLPCSTLCSGWGELSHDCCNYTSFPDVFVSLFIENKWLEEWTCP